ncbi:YbaL family putative K(+) efflux transporter [Bordetella sp. FB-8]|uniref:YbaL family putative K(+) efflux transporter n=1 Tax=Bordetella sp. FB-8 TaxID=1159870 RepID=UPI00035CFAE3|nr:YbaL family putative K(+) efflux transporter [Bordetella sp. FB-8]
MDHSIPLITTLAEGFGMALVLGFVAERIKVPALVGYLLAGILIGPATPGVVADVKLASELSEIGVMLLMFGVGLHFSLRDLLDVKRLAVPGAVVQMTLATAMGMLIAWWWGWSWGGGLVFGLSLSCASTVVLLKALEARGALETQNGRIAVGWLVVEDLATVLVLVLLPPLAGVLGGHVLEQSATGTALWLTLGKTLLEVAVFIALMLAVGRRALPWLLWQVARTGSRELFTLAVVAVAIGIAYGAAQLFHVSFALGAFFAGMVMRESEFSHRAAQESLPLRDAFSVLFFVAVGMLFDPAILIREPLHVLGVLLIIMLGKSLVSLALVLLLRYPLTTALTVSASLAQIGEFSFILAGLGVALGLLPPEGMSLVLAGAILSIALNPILFAVIEPLRRVILARCALARKLEASGDPYAELPESTARKNLDGQVVLVGYGRVGRHIAAELTAHAIPIVVADQSREVVEDLRQQGQAAVLGDAAEPGVLIQAHIAHAAMLVATVSDVVGMRKMVDTARTLNPQIEIVLVAQSEDEMRMLRDENIGEVFLGDEQLARGMAGYVRTRFAQ